MRRAAPLLLAVSSLAFGFGAATWLSSEAKAAVDQLLLEQVRGAGAVVAAFAPTGLEDGAALRRLKASGDFDEVSLVEGQQVLADGAGLPAHGVDLLRFDAEKLSAAAAGTSAVSLDYEVGGLPFAVGYFPVPGPVGSGDGRLDSARGERGRPGRVLVVEAGSRFAEPARRVARARTTAFVSSFVGALALFFLALAWSRLETRWRAAAAQAAFAQALQRFAAMAAHEVRNPLATIRGLLELYRERRGDGLGEDGARVVKDVLGEVDRLSRVTGDLLDLSSERPLSTEPRAVEELVKEAASLHPSLTVRCPDTHTMVEVDALRLGQVLQNLLRNAAQAKADATVNVEVKREGGLISVRLHDDGPGVSAAQQQRLFQPFASEKPGGHGLGLALSQRLVERMGGTLRFVSTARGACFELSLSPSPCAAGRGPG
ncbi:MAG: HAMP domain-containing sensor histidine kinase [Archangium sp.]|nr:HAMP domain-containing sensor histidine kinase [Archangium sp.]